MKYKQGFTLIELMIVIIVIAVLAAIAIPSYQGHVTKAKIKEAQSNLIALSLSAESSYQRTLAFPIADLNNTAAIKTNDVFKTWNPSSNVFSYEFKSTDGSSYTLTAKGIDPKMQGCQLTLSNQGTRTISGCSSTSEWVN
jgi:type IV pilus assembly protein PilE